MAKTGNQLIAEVQLTITAPNNQVLLTDDRILSFANEEISSLVVPMIVSLNQEFFVYLETENTVNGQSEYDIPYRAIGRMLRELKLKDPTSAGAVWNVPQIYLEDFDDLQWSAQRYAYFFKGDQFRLVPTPDSTVYQLLKYYLLRPNAITKLDAAGTITNIAGNVIDVAVVPTTFTAGAKVDFIKGRQGNRTVSMDQTITNVAGNQVTISDVPSNLSVGDYVSIAEQSPVLQLPDEVFSYLVYLTAKRCLYAIGDYEGMRGVDEQIPEKRRMVETLLAPRNQGEQIKIVNRRGLLRINRNGFWRGIIR